MTKDRMFALSLGLAGVVLWGAQAAQGAPAQCGPRGQVAATLAERYGETRRAIGLAANNTVMEVYASDEGSWTITVTMPDGTMCLLAAGQNYEGMAEELPARGTRI
jgi:hypothetical protein